MRKYEEEGMSEEDLYEPVCMYLKDQGFVCRGEVDHCDVAAVRDDRLIVVELKNHLNLDVIIQATLRQRLTDDVYIAVPKPSRYILTKKWGNTCHLLRRLGIGLMLVTCKGRTVNGSTGKGGIGKGGTGKGSVEVMFDPGEFRREQSKTRSKGKRARLLKEFNGRSDDYNKGGSKGKKLVTRYREMAVHIACCLDIKGVLSPKQLREMGTDTVKTRSILANNHYGWFIRESIGKYRLSDAGREDMKNYAGLIEYYNEKIGHAESE